MPQTHRMERVNQLLREELSDLLLRETKDPRLSGYISINTVETSADLRYARVMVSCVCDEQRKQEILAGLAHSAGFFRSVLSKKLTIKRMPEFKFIWDTSIERGSRLVDLIDRVSSENPPAEK